jgi:hypothetical protein
VITYDALLTQVTQFLSLICAHTYAILPAYRSLLIAVNSAKVRAVYGSHKFSLYIRVSDVFSIAPQFLFSQSKMFLLAPCTKMLTVVFLYQLSSIENCQFHKIVIPRSTT